MLPIRALNEDPEESSGSNDVELKVTGEAEESIVVSEYLRALNFISSNQRNNALTLLLELVETEILSKVSKDAKDNKLFLVKYNCYRNIGLLYKEECKHNLALDYLIRAVELCFDDVYTMYILAHLALKLGHISVAKTYYEKCIKRNSNHWPSLDGILQLYLVSGNIIEAYYWAVHNYEKDDKYMRTTDVLYEINSRFSSSISFFDELLQNNSHAITFTRNKFLSPVESCFDKSYDGRCADSENSAQVDIYSEVFKVNHLNWITLAQWIIQIHQYLVSNGQVPQQFEFKKFFTIQDNIEELDNTMGAPLRVPEDDQVPESIDNRNTKSIDLVCDLETKSRRRGSELKILEQWGWHKSRRSSRKKSAYESSDTVESTADEFLKRVLGQYFVKKYNEEASPFSDQLYGLKNHSNNHAKNAAQIATGHFMKQSKTIFDGLIAGIELREIDTYLLVYTYLFNLSLFWNEPMPEEICALYIQVYSIFAKYNTYQSWNQLTNDEVTGLFQMTILYLELFHDNIVVKLLHFGESEDNRLFENLYNGLQLYVTYLTEDNFVIYKSRYLWLSYAVHMHNNDIDAALKMVTQMHILLEEQTSTFEISLPNQNYNNFYNKLMVHEIIESLQRQINLRSVKELYSKKNYHALVAILKDSLSHTTDIQSNTNPTLKISAQIEILLECFWRMEQFLECIIWAEKSLKYTVDTFVSQQSVPYRQKNWAKTINFILLYIQSLIEKEGDYIMTIEFIPRLVQTIHKILNNQLDSHCDKQPCNQYMIDCWRAWIILYYILERQDDQNMLYRKNRGVNQDIPENEDDSLFSSIMLFFVAHELLGRRQWCSKGSNQLLLKMLDVIVPKLRSPMLEPYRDVISECLEQTTYCLFGYPPKKGRNRHLQDHESTIENLSWQRAIQLFDIYRPDVLPEFNSYKIDSISADMEALLQQILMIISHDCDVSTYVRPIMDFINGKNNTIPKMKRRDGLSFKIRPIYYILADFYFKSRDFSKAIEYYAMDLTVETSRFDSWAGISLSKASKCETILNSAGTLCAKKFLDETKNTMRCFEQSLMLNEHDSQLWVEYGSFAYNISSYCARTLKSLVKSSDSFSYLNSQQVYYMNVAYKSFNRVNSETCFDLKQEHDYRGSNEDEKWLYHYMLGKIAEKQKSQPMVYLVHYLQAAKCLYECNATYPIKVNHSNPSQLSIEALELFYRANAAIIKYTENHSSIGKHEAGLFKKILKELAISPFAVNRAKISDVTFKKKSVGSTDKTQNVITCTSSKIGSNSIVTTGDNTLQAIECLRENLFFESDGVNKQECSTRRMSQESILATNTTTTTTSSSGTDSLSTDSESNSSTDDEMSNSSVDRDAIFKVCIKNMEECVTRFPEHYKSVYRLAYHYMNAPGATRSLEKCNQLLLGSYQTTLGNQIPGLFTERRSNNFFNGIWRIPSSDIDRPGSFASHLSKCVTILIKTLKHNMDHDMLLELAIQLSRRPDTDKEYLNDYDRYELSQQAVLTCINVYQTMLKQLQESNHDGSMLDLLVDIFKAYRKCVKNMPHKEFLFTEIMKQAYKIYIQDKAIIPESANTLDLAIKLCTYEVNYRKSIEKLSVKQTDKPSKIINTSTDMPSTMITPMQPISAAFIPGLTKQRKISAPKLASSMIMSIAPVTKMIPVGPSSIISTSLPGLTITPVNILRSPKPEKKPEASESTAMQSVASGLKMSNPEGVKDLSMMYLNNFPNRSIDDEHHNHSRLSNENNSFQ